MDRCSKRRGCQLPSDFPSGYWEYTAPRGRMGHSPAEMEVHMSTSIVQTKSEILLEINPIPLIHLDTASWPFKTFAIDVNMDLLTRLSTAPMNAPETERWYNL